MKITMAQPDGPYRSTIDTEALEVTLREVFLGVRFETADGCRLAVCMRDDGYEVRLDDGPWITLRPGGESPGRGPKVVEAMAHARTTEADEETEVLAAEVERLEGVLGRLLAATKEYLYDTRFHNDCLAVVAEVDPEWANG